MLPPSYQDIILQRNYEIVINPFSVGYSVPRLGDCPDSLIALARCVQASNILDVEAAAAAA
jgi:hypothetical protein